MHTWDCGHRAYGYGAAIEMANGRIVCPACAAAERAAANCEIVRIDRRDGSETRVAHDLTRKQAEAMKDSMDASRLLTMPDGSPRCLFEVREQGGGR